MIILKEKSNFF